MSISKKYTFLNCHISDVIFTYFAFLVVSIIALLFSNIPLWIAPAIITICLILYLWTRTGTLEITPQNGKFNIQMKVFSDQKTFMGPFKYEHWWDYTFNEGIIPEDWESGKRRQGGSNNVNTVLQLVDKNDVSIHFHERIIFDTRFPNEANYRAERNPTFIKSIKVQRLDKLLRFLQLNIEEDHFRNINSEIG